MAVQEALRGECIDSIRLTGYVSLDFPRMGSDIDPLFAAFRAVLAEVYEKPGTHGQDVIDAFAVETPGRPLDSRGFIDQRRRGRINTYEVNRSVGTDEKDVLHFTPQTPGHVQEHLRTRGGTPKAVEDLLAQCVDLHQAVRTSLQPTLQALGLAEYLLAPQNSGVEDVHLLRIIRYLGTTGSEHTFKAADPLAELHFDRSKATVAVWESSSGLVGAPGNNSVGRPELTVEELDQSAAQALASPIQHNNGSIKLFAGAGYNHLPPGLRQHSGDLPLLLHGVTDDKPGTERDAVVVFINQHTGLSCGTATAYETGLSDVRASTIDRQERHGRPLASD